MRLHYGDMFDLFSKGKSSMIVVTTNTTTTTPEGGPIRPANFGVMGAGSAKQAADRWPEAREWWAKTVAGGARTGFYATDTVFGDGRFFGSLVVKDHWWQKHDGAQVTERMLSLIEHGIERMACFVDDHPQIKKVVMPYPGIGNGGLPIHRVEPLLETLDDRFIVCRLDKPQAQRKVVVHTGNLHAWKDDPRFVDITMKSGLTAFAPTWQMIQNYKAGELSEEGYIEEYLRQMRLTYQGQREVWQGVLARKEAILGCYCEPGARFCHRYLLAEIFERLGASVGKELLADGAVADIPRLAASHMKGGKS